MHKYTVISVNEDDGQTFCHHVWATDGLNAFASAAEMEPNLNLTLVVSLPGWLDEGNQLTFPGESAVDSETVQAQPEVFGKPAYKLKAKDIEEVLAGNAVRVLDSKGKPFKTMAKNMIEDLREDFGDAIAFKAMAADTPNGIRPAALKAIEAFLQTNGVLKPCTE